MRWLKSLQRLFILLLISYGAVLLFYTAFQRSLIYFPSKLTKSEAVEIAKSLGLAAWTRGTGTLYGWYRPNPLARYRAVIFHGNAGNALDRTYLLEGLAGRNGEHLWEVYIFEYPGYGALEGKPTQNLLVTTACEAVSELFSKNSDIPIVLVGESLGTGVAAQVASKVPGVKGMILITPFSSLKEVAQAHFSWIPASILLKDTFNSSDALKHYKGPLAVLIAGQDEIIPRVSSENLFANYSGPKMLQIQEDSSHNDLDLSAELSWWSDVRTFIENATLAASQKFPEQKMPFK